MYKLTGGYFTVCFFIFLFFVINFYETYTGYKKDIFYAKQCVNAIDSSNKLKIQAFCEKAKVKIIYKD